MIKQLICILGLIFSVSVSAQHYPVIDEVEGDGFSQLTSRTATSAYVEMDTDASKNLGDRFPVSEEYVLARSLAHNVGSRGADAEYAYKVDFIDNLTGEAALGQLDVSFEYTLAAYQYCSIGCALNNNGTTRYGYATSSIEIVTYDPIADVDSVLAEDKILSWNGLYEKNDALSINFDLDAGLELWVVLAVSVHAYGLEPDRNNLVFSEAYADPLITVAQDVDAVKNLSSTPLRVGDETANISPVPIPATAWLFISALISLVGFKRKK